MKSIHLIWILGFLLSCNPELVTGVGPTDYTTKQGSTQKIETAVPRQAMDTLQAETDTAEWIVGKVGIITVVIAEPELLKSHTILGVDIGLSAVPVSAYYLVALEGALPNQFDIIPTPGQQEKQHRAPHGYPATWRYEVTPLRTGDMDLLFTLKVFQETATAGTSIATRPFHVHVKSHFPKSQMFKLNYWIAHNGGWGPIIGLIAASFGALGGAEWWRRWHKRRLNSKK